MSKTLAALEELQEDADLLSLMYLTAMKEDPVEFEKRVANNTGQLYSRMQFAILHARAQAGYFLLSCREYNYG